MERRGRPAVIRPDVRQIFLGDPRWGETPPVPRSPLVGARDRDPRSLPRALSHARTPRRDRGAINLPGRPAFLLLLGFRRRLLALLVELAKLFLFAHLQ